MKELYLLIDYTFNKKITQPNYHVHLYHTQLKDSFSTFLIKNRLNKFLQLKLLYELGKDKDYYILIRELKHYDQETDDPIKHGNCIFTRTFTYTQVFDLVVAHLDFQHIRIDNPYPFMTCPIHNKNGLVSYPQRRHPAFDELVFISTDGQLVLDNNTAYYKDFKKIQDITQYYKPIFDEFLMRTANGVPHELYIQWLLSWFPGQIKVKTIQ